jgi:uncharacterized protein (TIGR00251 family)
VSTTVIRVLVKPRSRESALAQGSDGSWTARLKAPPVDGKANDELLALVARHFGCRASAVMIVGGATARLKRVKIELP